MSWRSDVIHVSQAVQAGDELPVGEEGLRHLHGVLLLIPCRWNKLVKGFFNEKKSKFDISKIPDIYVSQSVGSG